MSDQRRKLQCVQFPPSVLQSKKYPKIPREVFKITEEFEQLRTQSCMYLIWLFANKDFMLKDSLCPPPSLLICTFHKRQQHNCCFRFHFAVSREGLEAVFCSYCLLPFRQQDALYLAVTLVFITSGLCSICLPALCTHLLWSQCISRC